VGGEEGEGTTLSVKRKFSDHLSSSKSCADVNSRVGTCGGQGGSVHLFVREAKERLRG